MRLGAAQARKAPSGGSGPAAAGTTTGGNHGASGSSGGGSLSGVGLAAQTMATPAASKKTTSAGFDGSPESFRGRAGVDYIVPRKAQFDYFINRCVVRARARVSRTG